MDYYDENFGIIDESLDGDEYESNNNNDLLDLNELNNNRKRKSLQSKQPQQPQTSRSTKNSRLSVAKTPLKYRLSNQLNLPANSKSDQPEQNCKKILAFKIDRLCEFSECWMHCVLYKINYYNKKTHFDKYLKYDIVVYVSLSYVKRSLVFFVNTCC
jgi:hypothetical protein